MSGEQYYTPVALLSPFESDLYDMTPPTNFKPVRSDFQKNTCKRHK